MTQFKVGDRVKWSEPRMNAVRVKALNEFGIPCPPEIGQLIRKMHTARGKVEATYIPEPETGEVYVRVLWDGKTSPRKIRVKSLVLESEHRIND
jgi:hypothetical protein